MGFNKIREVILAEAQAEAAHILDGAKRAADEHLHAARARIDDEAARAFRARAQAVDDELNRDLIQFKGNAGKQVLARRGEILRSVFTAARREILGWSPEEYGRLMGRLLEKAAAGTGGRVRIHSEDAPVFETVLSGINKDRGMRELVEIDGERRLPERGGFVFITSEYEVDQTLATLLRDLEQDMLPIIAGELFA